MPSVAERPGRHFSFWRAGALARAGPPDPPRLLQSQTESRLYVLPKFAILNCYRMFPRALIVALLCVFVGWSQPPPVIEAPKPVTPKPIRVGPAPPCLNGWGCLPNRLSQVQMMEFERILKLSPDDVCARGYLISAYPHDWSISQSASQHISRTEHLLWMVRNHAEWDGFTITPLYSLMNPRSVVERGSRTQLKQAWTEQIGPMQHRGIVLHNAALIFAIE